MLMKEFEYFLNELDMDDYTKFKYGKQIIKLRSLMAREPSSSGAESEALRQIQVILTRTLTPKHTVTVTEGAPAQPVAKRRGRPPRVAPQTDS